MAISADKTLEELFKFRLAQLKADSEGATTTISQIARLIAYGLIALIIPFVSAEPTKVPLVVLHHPLMVLFASMTGCIAVACDLAQNHFVDKGARAELDRLQKNLQKSNLVVTLPSEFMTPFGSSRDIDLRVESYRAKLSFTALGTVVIFIAVLWEMY